MEKRSNGYRLSAPETNLNYIVAIYLILIGVIGLAHF